MSRRFRNDAMGTARRRFVGGARTSAAALFSALGRHAGTERSSPRIAERHAWAVVLFRRIETRDVLASPPVADVHHLPCRR